VSDDVSFSVCSLPTRDFLARVDELVDIHLRAMNYPQTARLQRRLLWSANAKKPGFASVIALQHPSDSLPDPADRSQPAVGVAYGFPGDDRTWWYREVHRGLRMSGLSAAEATSALAEYDEISEVHVAPESQGHGIGHRMLDTLLPQLSSPVAMLSTPEVDKEANAAWALYRDLGFEDVLRNFRFGTDPRPFGILCLQRQQCNQRTMS
jgi:ribosomal protein S18 acetylase RimI-like enzyme